MPPPKEWKIRKPVIKYKWKNIDNKISTGEYWENLYMKKTIIFTLKSGALICQLSHSIEYKIYNFLSNCVMSTSIIICGIFFPSYELLWVEELSISSSSYFINNRRLKINEYSTGNMLSSSSFREKCVERIVSTTYLNKF